MPIFKCANCGKDFQGRNYKDRNTHQKFCSKECRKEYKNVIYEEGEYESVVITIGDGNGKNFWCVLFPPLCMLDEDSNIEYSSLVKEIIDKYF